MISELDLARTTAALYAPADGDFDRILAYPWVIGVKRHAPNFVQVVCRGSVTETDFLDDLRSELGEPVPGLEALGPLPFGFARGLPAAYDALADFWGPQDRVAFTGHSLGAARACELAGAYALRTGAPCNVQGLGCPRPGTRELAAALSACEVRLYRNGHDPVWNVPFPVPSLHWAHPGATTMFRSEPLDSPNDAYGHEVWHTIPFIRWHQAALYVDGVARLAQT